MNTFVPLLIASLLLCVRVSADASDASNANRPVPTVCTANGLASSYDVIVIGSGPGGSVAARRLAEYNPSWQILQLERGISYAACPTCYLASNISTLNEVNSGPFIPTLPQPNVAGGPMFIKDAAVQGGGSSVNSANNARGDAFRYFPANFPSNWDWNTMKQYYEKYENYQLPPHFQSGSFNYAANFRGNSGPVVVDQTPLYPFTAAWIPAIKAVFPNMPVFTNRSINDGEFPGIGSAPSEATANNDVRVSAYTAYIQTYTGSNLKAVYNTLVNKILFSGSNVSGVIVTFNNGSNSCVIRTNRVVVSAGAYGTPKLLKLSGVGPKAELRSFNIPVVSNVAAIGANLSDHFTFFSFYSGYTDDLVNAHFPDVIVDAYYNAADQGPQAQNDMSYQISKGSTPGQLVFAYQRTNMNARGFVTLNSTDATNPPNIDPNYFGDTNDKFAAGLALVKFRQIAARLNLTAINDPCAAVGAHCSSPMGTFNAYIAAGAFFVGLHYTATASLCQAVNPLSLRVLGTSGLYVLDASILPKSPAAHSQSTVYAASERGVDLINANMKLSTHQAENAETQGWNLCSAGCQQAEVETSY